MGAQQSSGREANAQSGETTKRCYYEVLGVERTATDDEIKKAYRRKALELHPDRNYGDVENATAKFAEVQSAHEVLSDPQERAWYDSHRESILRGDGGSTEDHFEHNVRLTSAGDIVGLISRFSKSVPFTDAPDGFYGILRETFAKLAKEEDLACDRKGIEPGNYPDFGSVADSYEDVVRPFYRVWINFSTKKSFSWRDVYKSSDAPDRQTRRLIDKENKRLRDEGIREFNDAVRSLVAFVRKRDPRYVPNSQSEADRQKLLREVAAAQAARSRAINQAKLNKHVVQDWATTQEPEDESTFTESEESEVEHIECVVCRKIFKSEKQYETHEKSKKHIKAVHHLQREMRKENAHLNLDGLSGGESNAPVSDFEQISLDDTEDRVAEASAISSDSEKRGRDTFQINISDDAESPLEHKSTPATGISPDISSDSSEQNEEYATREQVEERLANSLATSPPREDRFGRAAAAPSGASDADGTPRLGKAKLKRAKKKARDEKVTRENMEFECGNCKESFNSKTKLFNHINEFGHAQPVSKVTKGNKKGR